MNEERCPAVDRRLAEWLTALTIGLLVGCSAHDAQPGSSSVGIGTWAPMAAGPISLDSTSGSAAWNGKEMVVWIGAETPLYHYSTADIWKAGSRSGARYHARSSPSLVWA